MFKAIKGPLALVAVAAMITACAAAGPRLASVKASIPALEEGKGRLFFYREYAAFGSGMRGDILVCGKKVGESIPGGVFYVDLPAGECEVSVPAIVSRGQTRLTVRIGEPNVQYVRTSIGSAGFRGLTDIDLVAEAPASAAMQDLAVTNPAQ